MVKHVLNKYPIHELLRQRWSPRAFANRPVEPEKLLSILEAARWSQSTFNEQPWSFVLASKEDQPEHERLLSCLNEGNLRWARCAPVLMLSVARLNFEKNGRPNRHALHDVGMAVASMVLQATSLGLSMRQMAGFFPDKARDRYAIPEGYEPVAVIALGYLGKVDTLPEELREKELSRRNRKEMREFVFAKQWGKAAPLANMQ
ncbi:MAG: nitroreductase family protein [Ignavibacteria bacterium]|nr:nitroreductase family protein [Ignavibacteria bacterium]